MLTSATAGPGNSSAMEPWTSPLFQQGQACRATTGTAGKTAMAPPPWISASASPQATSSSGMEPPVLDPLNPAILTPSDLLPKLIRHSFMHPTDVEDKALSFVFSFIQISAWSSESVWSVRIRSTTLARLLHGFVLLPSRISGKMIISLDTITIIAMLVVSFLSLSRYLPAVCQASKNAMISL